MSKLTKGEVRITLDGEERTLKPTLQAFTTLSARYDNYGQLLGKIASGNVPAIIFTLRQGLGYNDQQAKKLPDQIFKTGVSSLIDPLSDFVYRLYNNGKSADEVMAEQIDAPGAGDDASKAGQEADADPLLAG